MSTTVSTLLTQLAQCVQEDGSAYGYYDWSHGLWGVDEIIGYINVVQKDLVLRSQIIKLIAAVASIAGTRLYSDPAYTMEIDRIAFNNKALYRTNKYLLDRENPAWRTVPGMPKQYHQDLLPTKTFETDKAPTSAMTGSGYNIVGSPYGVLRMALSNSTRVTDAAMTSGFSFVNSASANFTAADVGKTIAVAGALSGGGTLISTISTRNSATQVLLAVTAGATVTGAVAAWGTPYGATLPGGGGGGFLRYAYGPLAINGILPHDRPYAGTLRQMFSGTTNFEVLATRLIDDVSGVDDLLRVPDFCVLYLKMGVLTKMLAKEGEGQDLPRAKYCWMRYTQGAKLLERLMTSKGIDLSQPAGARV